MARRPTGTLLAGRRKDDPLSEFGDQQLRPGEFMAAASDRGAPVNQFDFISNVPSLEEGSTIGTGPDDRGIRGNMFQERKPNFELGRPPAFAADPVLPAAAGARPPAGAAGPRPPITSLDQLSAAERFRLKHDTELGSVQDRERRRLAREAAVLEPGREAARQEKAAAVQAGKLAIKEAPARAAGEEARKTEEAKEANRKAAVQKSFENDVKLAEDVVEAQKQKDIRQGLDVNAPEYKEKAKIKKDFEIEKKTAELEKKAEIAKTTEERANIYKEVAERRKQVIEARTSEVTTTTADTLRKTTRTKVDEVPEVPVEGETKEFDTNGDGFIEEDEAKRAINDPDNKKRYIKWKGQIEQIKKFPEGPDKQRMLAYVSLFDKLIAEDVRNEIMKKPATKQAPVGESADVPSTTLI